MNNANGNAWGKFEMGWETEKKRCEQGKNEREKEKEGKEEGWHGDAACVALEMQRSDKKMKEGYKIREWCRSGRGKRRMRTRKNESQRRM